MGYVRGVRLTTDLESAGIIEGLQFTGTEATPTEPPIHVSTLHGGWADTEIEALAQKGSLAPWSTVADDKVQPRSCIFLPLGQNPTHHDVSGMASTLFLCVSTLLSR